MKYAKSLPQNNTPSVRLFRVISSPQREVTEDGPFKVSFPQFSFLPSSGFRNPHRHFKLTPHLSGFLVFYLSKTLRNQDWCAESVNLLLFEKDQVKYECNLLDFVTLLNVLRTRSGFATAGKLFYLWMHLYFLLSKTLFSQIKQNL